MSEHHTITRRKLLQPDDGAGSICAGHNFALAGRTLSQFDYGEVQLAPGPLQKQFEENHQLLLNLSEDRRDETCDTGPTKEGYIACSKAERRNCARLDSWF